MSHTVDRLVRTCESLIRSATGVIQRWESGDLAEAVTHLGATASKAKEIITELRHLTARSSQPKGTAAERFKATVEAIPQYCAVFKVIRATTEMPQQGLCSRQEVRYYPASDLAWYRTQSHPSLKDGSINHLSIAPSGLRFMGYEPVKEFPWDERRRVNEHRLEATR